MFVTIRAAVIAAAAGVVAALVGLAAHTSVVAVVLLVDGVMALAAIVDVLTAPSPGSLRPQRSLPAAATTGEAGTIALRLRNPTGRRLVVAVRDASPPSLARNPLAHRIALPARSVADVFAEIAPSRRGRIPVGPITIRTEGRLGLAGRQGIVVLSGELKVYPPLPGRAHVSLRLNRALALQSGERSTAVRGGGGEFDSLREYHPDDEFRRINWRATARASKPISNVFREERNQQVMLMLDAGRMMAGTVGGVPRFEWGIDAAIAVAELAARVGDHVGMVAFAGEIRALIPPRSGRSHPARMLEAVFALEPMLEASNYVDVFASVLGRWRRRSLLILITEITDETAMEPLLRALPILLRRHVVIVGAIEDPEILTAALATPASSEEVYRKAAAGGAIDARERAAGRIAGLGAIVVDRPYDRIAGALADQYLRIKASGRL